MYLRNAGHAGSAYVFFFFFDIPSSLLLRIDYHQMLSVQESVGHITCTLWSSPQLSTIYEFYLWVFTNRIIMLLSWGPRCLRSASSAPWRLRLLRHLRGLRPLQVKTTSWGRIYNISKLILTFWYFEDVISKSPKSLRYSIPLTKILRPQSTTDLMLTKMSKSNVIVIEADVSQSMVYDTSDFSAIWK